MRLLVAALLALPAVAVAGGPLLTADGACPGIVDMGGAGLTPGGAIVLLYSTIGAGSDSIALGPCAGTVTGLAGPRFGVRTTASPSGSFSASPNAPGGACGASVQLLNVATCTMSNVVVIGDVPMGGDFAGYITWSQTAGSQSDVEQDAIMNDACDAAFPGSRAASVEEIGAGAIAGLPATNDSGQHLVGACPGCEGLPHAGCVDGHARYCVDPGAAFPGLPPGGWNGNCHTATRTAACVF